MSYLVSNIKSQGIDHIHGAPTLKLEDVSVVYSSGVNTATPNSVPIGNDGKFAIQSVSFQINAGQQVAIVGPNGAGKSTLFKVIVGALKPSSGVVNIFGHDPDCHICIAYVPQRSQIDWTFPVTVEDVVMMGRTGQIGLFRWPRKRDWEQVRQSLERVKANHLAKKQIGELSGGQQQRVFIARAIAQGADLLLMDEPFSGLDLTSHEAILEILDSLKIDGVTVLVATHDLKLAAERFDQVLLLNRQIIAYGPPASVLSSQNLVQAFGGQLHLIENGENRVIMTDECSDPE